MRHCPVVPTTVRALWLRVVGGVVSVPLTPCAACLLWLCVCRRCATLPCVIRTAALYPASARPHPRPAATGKKKPLAVQTVVRPAAADAPVLAAETRTPASRTAGVLVAAGSALRATCTTVAVTGAEGAVLPEVSLPPSARGIVNGAGAEAGVGAGAGAGAGTAAGGAVQPLAAKIIGPAQQASLRCVCAHARARACVRGAPRS